MTDLTPEALDALQDNLNAINRNYELARGVHHTVRHAHDTITALRAQLADGSFYQEKDIDALMNERDALRAQLATARADAVRETASVARQHIYYDSAGTGFQEEAFDNAVLALIDQPTPSAPSPEAVARAALDGFPSDDDREWIDARADELFRSSERQRGGIRPATITPRDFRDFFVVNATAERIAAIIAKAGGGE